MSTETANTESNASEGSLKLKQPDYETIPDNEVNARCDAACPATAQVRTDLISGRKLFFCGHHYNANAFELLTTIHVIRDEREWKPEDPELPKAKTTV